MKRLKILFLNFVIILTFNLYVLFNKNDYKLYPKVFTDFSDIDDHVPLFMKRPTNFFAERGPWPITHLINNVIITVFITHSPLITYIIALIREGIEALIAVFVLTVKYVPFDKRDFLVETIFDSVLGDIFCQCSLGCIIGSLMLNTFKIEPISAFKNRKANFFVLMYVMMIVLFYISDYTMIYNLLCKDYKKDNSMKRFPFGTFIGLSLKLIVLELMRILDLKDVKKNYSEVVDYKTYKVKTRKLYDNVSLLYFCFIITSFFMTSYSYMSTWSTSLFYLLYLIINTNA